MSDETTTERDTIEQLADSFVARYRTGERPGVEEYAERYPELADELREILPALVLLEQNASPNDTASFVGEVSKIAMPQTIGDFTIIREIGHGGMGVVYEAMQRSLSRRVALKVLSLAATLDERALQRFRNETMAVAQLDHPNIVDVIGVGVEQGVHFYAMRYIEGVTVADVITRLAALNEAQKPTFPNSLSELAAPEKSTGAWSKQPSGESILPSSEWISSKGAASRSRIEVAKERDSLAAETYKSRRDRASTRHSFHSPAFVRAIVELGIQVADALDHAHQLGIIHRDVKPSNLLVDTHGKIWVTDFGLARIGAATGLTMTGDMLGTLRYMSPEQALAKRVPIDHRTDIYSLGATLYELLTLRPAFEAKDRSELLRQIAMDEPPAPRRLNAAIPAELEIIVSKAIAKHASERYATAQELADDLRLFVADKPIRARRPSLLNRLGKWSRRHRALVAACALLILLATIGSSISAVLLAEERNKTAAALTESQRQKRQLQVNAKQLERERQRAEANFQRAREAVDKLFTRAADELKDQPHMEQIRSRLLEDALEFYESFLLEKGEDVTVREEAAANYLRVGEIRQLLGQHDKSVGSLEQVEALLKPLMKQHPQDEYLVQMGHANFLLAYAMIWTDQTNNHLAYRRKSLANYEQLAQQSPQNPKYLKLYADAREEYACAFSVAGQYAQAVEEFSQAHALYDKYQGQFPTAPSDRARLAHLHHWLGRALKATGRLIEAEQEYRAAHDLRVQLLAEEPGDAFRKHHLAHIKSYLAGLLNVTGRSEESLELIQQALVLYEECLDDFPHHADFLQRRAADNGELSITLATLGRSDEAEVAMQRSAALYEEQIADDDGPVRIPRDLAWMHYRLGVCLEAAGDHEQAADMFRRAISGFEQIVASHSDSPRLFDNLARILATCPAVQFRDPARAVKLANEALKPMPNNADFWGTLGVAQYYASDHAQAIQTLEKAERMKSEDITSWLFLSMAYSQEHDREKARQYFEKSVIWLEKNRSTDKELERFRLEASKLIGKGADTTSNPQG